MGRPGLVGRSAEVAETRRILDDALRTGKGSTILLEGEPGIGTTRLLQTVVDDAARLGFAIGVATAQPAEITPGAAVLLALRSGDQPVLDQATFSSLAALHQEPLWLVDRLAAVLENLARQQPLLIAIDDVQSADPLTQFALRALPGRLSGSAIVWLLAGHGPDVGDFADLTTRSSHTAVITLQPLDRAAIDAMATDHLGSPPSARVAALLDGLGGNPFWATQLLIGLAAALSGRSEEVPTSFVECIRRHLLSLTEEAVEIVQAAAVWNAPVQAGIAAELLGSRSATVLRAVREAVQLGLLTEGPGGLCVRLELVRAVVHGDISPSSRRELHRTYGRHLAASGHAFAAAPHYRASATVGDDECITALRNGAADAPSDQAEAAADLLSAALRLAPPGHAAWSDLAAGAAAAADRARDTLDLGPIDTPGRPRSVEVGRAERGRIRRRPDHGWDALTESEIRVAMVVSGGATNRSTATLLRVSEHTVSTHLRSVFAKLDVRSRVQLSNAWHAHQTQTAAHADVRSPLLAAI